MRVRGILLQFGHRGVGVLIRHHDRALEAWLRFQPLVQNPFIHGVAHRRAELPVLIRLAVVAGGIEDAKHAIVLIQQLLLHERQGTTLTAALGRISVAAGGVGLALRVSGPLLIGLPRAGAEGLHMLDPALLQIRVQRLVVAALRMDVAVGGGELRRVGRGRQWTRGNLNVHETPFLKRALVARAVSVTDNMARITRREKRSFVPARNGPIVLGRPRPRTCFADTASPHRRALVPRGPRRTAG